MSNVETIENEIEKLTESDMKQLRAWFYDWDSSHWDDRIETDVRQGKLASFAQLAVQEHKDGKTTRI